MKVSTITVVLNNKETVKDPILSVGSQDYNDIEHIIDGKSMDGTQSVIDKYRDRLAVLISERNHGIYDAMNKGLRIDSREIFGFLSLDDFYANEGVYPKLLQPWKIIRLMQCLMITEKLAQLTGKII